MGTEHVKEHFEDGEFIPQGSVLVNYGNVIFGGIGMYCTGDSIEEQLDYLLLKLREDFLRNVKRYLTVPGTSLSINSPNGNIIARTAIRVDIRRPETQKEYDSKLKSRITQLKKRKASIEKVKAKELAELHELAEKHGVLITLPPQP